jgi:hypothetical protein
MSRRGSIGVLILGAMWIGCGHAQAEPPRRYASQLAAESAELIRRAIRRPYGWAWDAAASSEANDHPQPRTVSMEPLATPAAGLVLLWTGRFLGETRDVAAAEQVARGVAAAQESTGRVRSYPVYGPMAGGRQALIPIPDRTATRCALGLLLASIESDQADNPHQQQIRGAAARASHWLATQQSPNGLWPSTFPPGPRTRQTIRLVRLDDPDYRDSTYALLLAFDLLHDDGLHHRSTLPLDGLLRLRLVSDVHGPGLWCTACTVEGTDIPAAFPNGPDLLASRYAMQTLLGGYLLTGDRNLSSALNAAATTLMQVKRGDGLYDRFLDPTAAADMARAVGNAPATQSFFGQPRAQPASQPAGSQCVLVNRSLGGSFGIPELLDAIAHLQSNGPDRFAAALASGFSIHQQIEASLCGLIDDPLTLDFPVGAQGVPAYVSSHADLWKWTDGPPPDQLGDRVQRLWILLIRAKLERMSGAGGS